MALTEEEIKASLEILKILDEAIETGPWDHSLFFKGIGKKLRDARERFVHELNLDELLAEKPVAAIAQERTDLIEVYISLYQSEGGNIAKWQSVVSTIAGYSMTRPVYRNEADIQEAIRAKEVRHNDAYVVVRIHKEDILPPFTEKPPVDRHGHELLHLREGSVRLENIVRVVHSSGQYDFRNGMLIKRG